MGHEIDVHGTTPILVRNYGRPTMQVNARCIEIKSWLKVHGQEVSNFVVLDDMDMTHAFPKECVVVNGKTGLIDADVQKVTGLLNATRTVRSLIWHSKIPCVPGNVPW